MAFETEEESERHQGEGHGKRGLRSVRVKAEASAWPDDRTEVRTFGHALEVDSRGKAEPPPWPSFSPPLGDVAEKYCSVSVTLHNAGVEITTDVGALEAAPPMP